MIWLPESLAPRSIAGSAAVAPILRKGLSVVGNKIDRRHGDLAVTELVADEYRDSELPACMESHMLVPSHH